MPIDTHKANTTKDGGKALSATLCSCCSSHGKLSSLSRWKADLRKKKTFPLSFSPLPAHKTNVFGIVQDYVLWCYQESSREVTSPSELLIFAVIIKSSRQSLMFSIWDFACSYIDSEHEIFSDLSPPTTIASARYEWKSHAQPRKINNFIKKDVCDGSFFPF